MTAENNQEEVDEFFLGKKCCTLFHTENEELSKKIGTCNLERSENTLFWKLQNAHLVYGPRHNTDSRTIDEIIIG